MALDLRARIAALAADWESERAIRLRSRVVLVAGLVGAAGYAAWVNHLYPVKEWLFWRLLALFAYAGILSLACLSAGHAILTRARAAIDLPALEHAVVAVALGLVVFALGMYAGGAARLYATPFAVVLPLVMIASGARSLLAFARRTLAEREVEAPSPMVTIARIFGAIGVLVVYLQTLTPEAINFDAAWSHIPIAADYARAGRIIPFVADYTRALPHLASLVDTWAFLLPGLGESMRWMLVLHLEFVFFLWTLAGVAALCRYLLGETKTRATWAAFFLFPAIIVYDSNLGGASDHYVALFAAPIVLAALRAAPAFTWPRMALVGALAAGALLVKLQAVYLIAGAGILLLFPWIAEVRRSRARKISLGPLFIGPLVLGAVFAIITLPHWIENWVFYANPIYPMGQDIFTKSTPTTPRAAFLFEYLFKDYRHRPHKGLLRDLVDSIRLTLAAFSFEPHYSFTKNFPSTGSLFTLTLPFLPFVRGARRIGLGVVAGTVALFAWAWIFRVDRHLQTFAPILVAVTAAILVRAWELGRAARGGVIALVSMQVVWGGDAFAYSGKQRLDAALDLIRGGYEGQRAERFVFRDKYRKIAAALPSDAKVLLHHHRASLGINRETLLDWAGQQGLILYETVAGPRGAYDLLRSAGVTHLLHLPNGGAAATKEEDVLFHELLRASKTRVHFEDLELADMPVVPPPPDRPYRVFAAALTGYIDGVYRLETMNVYEEMPPHLRIYPLPDNPIADLGAGVHYLATSDAVLLGPRMKAPAGIIEKIERDFVKVGTYDKPPQKPEDDDKSLTIYLRKTPRPFLKFGNPP